VRDTCRVGAGGVELFIVPTALDNGQRSPRKLLAEVVRRVLYALRVALERPAPRSAFALAGARRQEPP